MMEATVKDNAKLDSSGEGNGMCDVKDDVKMDSSGEGGGMWDAKDDVKMDSSGEGSGMCDVKDDVKMDNCGEGSGVCEVKEDVNELCGEEKEDFNNFTIDRHSIEMVAFEKQAEELRLLNVSVYDQDILEQGILHQVDKVIEHQENERLKKMVQQELKSVAKDISSVEAKLKKNECLLKVLELEGNNAASVVEDQRIQQEKLGTLRAHEKTLLQKQKALAGEVEDVKKEECEELFEADPQLDLVLGKKQHEETDLERRIRLGEMTPFGTVLSSTKSTEKKNESKGSAYTEFEKYLLSQAEFQRKKVSRKKATGSGAGRNGALEKEKQKEESESSLENAEEKKKKSKSPLKIKILHPKKRKKERKCGTITSDKEWDQRKSAGKVPGERAGMDFEESDSEYLPSEDEEEEEEEEKEIVIKKEVKPRNVKPRKQRSSKVLNSDEWSTDDSDWDYSDEESRVKRRKKSRKEIDDGNMDDYLERLKIWEDELKQKKNQDNAGGDDDDDGGCEEFDEGYRIPHKIWNKLFNYQKVGVRWMWELCEKRCGGILGDEMGLGKTIQVIAFLAGLSYSRSLLRHSSFRGLGPCIIVCPTTLMHQWTKEFHQWWPPFRVAILHESGSHVGTRDSLIRNINRNNGILISSYVGVVQHQETLLKHDWHYIILDEGHKIRNPDAQVTLAVKQFRSPYRLILSGSPMQNNLKELWSLFDFIFPGKLGTLPVFLAEFAVPITQGGYANASEVQVATAFRCATILKDTISPYLLRRMKDDVKVHVKLPSKSEQVLFCRLTDEQRMYYQGYLDSGEVKNILDGRVMVFVGLIHLRKICNHPDLYSGGPKLLKGDDEEALPEEERYGHWKKAGKMIVVDALLRIWQKQGHRVLLFTQSKQMMCILELFIQKQGYTYMKLDGGTAISARQPLINKFNQDPSYFIFLLTTRVGGLGVNLTGANRVIIYDPDWNPATDTQARERAWRIGQQNQVTVYRLVTAGTIEEKIYHRQIFKQFLTNKVLKDPKQRRFFKSNDLLELFTLKEGEKTGTETSAIFAGTGLEVKVNVKRLKDESRKFSEVKNKNEKTKERTGFSDEKIRLMKELAQKLSKQITEKNATGATNNDKSSSDSNKQTSIEMEKEEGECDEEEDVRDKEKSSKDKFIKKKSKKKKRRKKTKDGMFEGQNVSHLVGQDVFKDKNSDEEAERNAKQDEYVLKKLFAKSGLQTALQHDAIMDEGEPDYMIVECEATRVAEQAVKALKESRRNCFQAQSGVPTWTGQSGFMKANPLSALLGGKKKKASLPQKDGAKAGPSHVKSSEDQPMSGEELLSRIYARNFLLPSNKEDGLGASSAPDENMELLADIRNFVSFCGIIDGQATTDEILDRFKERLPASNTPLFKAMLEQICEFRRTPDGKGIWKLKAEFR